MALKPKDLILSVWVPKHSDPSIEFLTKEAEIFKYNPWDMLANSNKDDELFFTKKTEERSNNMGCWVLNPRSPPENIYDGKKLVGIKKVFRYHLGGINGQATGWFLAEHDIHENFRARLNIPNGVEYVLCKVIYVAALAPPDPWCPQAPW